MKRSRNNRKTRGGTTAAAPAGRPPKETGAMAQMHEAMEHTDFLDSRRKTYVPKPRAVRRYEKFASMEPGK